MLIYQQVKKTYIFGNSYQFGKNKTT